MLALIAVVALLVLAAAPFFGTVEDIEEGRWRGGRGGRTGEREDGSVECEDGPAEREPIESDGSPGHDREDAEHLGEDRIIHGSMTLRDVQELTGVPMDHIITGLRLPADVSLDERLGRLRRSYGFEIDDIRRIVSGYESEDQRDTDGGR